MNNEQQGSGMGDGAEGPRGGFESAAGETRVVILVCELCGKDYSYEGQAPAGLKCEKCGGTVFRTFHETVGDEAAEDFRDTTERDLDPDDPEGDTLPGDILDLNRL